MNQSNNNSKYKNIFRVGYSILTDVCFRHHISDRLKVYINSLIITLPALVQYLLFREPEYLLSFVLCFSFAVSSFLLTRARLILTLPFAIISFIYTFFLVVYRKSLGSTSIMALMNTQVDVMFKFTVSPTMITATLILTIVFAVYLRFIILSGGKKGREELIPHGKRYIPVTIMIATTLFCIFGYAYVLKAYPFSLSTDSTTYAKIIFKMKKNAAGKYNFEGTLRPGYSKGKGSVVLIVGESARRASWSLYGYGRNTNTFTRHEIEEYPDNFILFRNHIATAQTTYPSLMSIFSPIPSKDFIHIPDHTSFVKILKSLDYKTYFISTYNNIFISFINADENIITKSTDDNDLIPVLKKILDDNRNSRNLIVMHLRGSHCALSSYEYTYSDYISPSGSPAMDKYDNSIIHTDIFMKDIAKLTMNEKEPLCVWYMSDHGENMNDSDDKNFMHGCSGFTKYEIEIPSLMLFNDSFMNGNPGIKTLKENKKLLISHSNVSHTIMGLCGVYPREYLSEYDVSSEAFMSEEPYLVDVDLFPIKYSKAEIKR